MDSIEMMKEKYEVGYKIFSELASFSDKGLKVKLKEIIGDKINSELSDGIFGKESHVTRETCNEKYRSIIIEWYDYIEINAFGVWYKPEHNHARQIVEFNKHFKL